MAGNGRGSQGEGRGGEGEGKGRGGKGNSPPAKWREVKIRPRLSFPPSAFCKKFGLIARS